MGPLDTAVNLHFCASAPNFKIPEHILPTEFDWGGQLAAAHLQEAGCRGILCLPPYGLPWEALRFEGARQEVGTALRRISDLEADAKKYLRVQTLGPSVSLCSILLTIMEDRPAPAAFC